MWPDLRSRSAEEGLGLHLCRRSGTQRWAAGCWLIYQWAKDEWYERGGPVRRWNQLGHDLERECVVHWGCSGKDKFCWQSRRVKKKEIGEADRRKEGKGKFQWKANGDSQVPFQELTVIKGKGEMFFFVCQVKITIQNSVDLGCNPKALGCFDRLKKKGWK